MPSADLELHVTTPGVFAEMVTRAQRAVGEKIRARACNVQITCERR